MQELPLFCGVEDISIKPCNELVRHVLTLKTNLRILPVLAQNLTVSLRTHCHPDGKGINLLLLFPPSLSKLALVNKLKHTATLGVDRMHANKYPRTVKFSSVWSKIQSQIFP